jgi:hypothetical protein
LGFGLGFGFNSGSSCGFGCGFGCFGSDFDSVLDFGWGHNSLFFGLIHSDPGLGDDSDFDSGSCFGISDVIFSSWIFRLAYSCFTFSCFSLFNTVIHSLQFFNLFSGSVTRQARISCCQDFAMVFIVAGNCPLLICLNNSDRPASLVIACSPEVKGNSPTNI